MSALRVVEAGLRSTVQDSGRRGYHRSAIPSAGPADPVAFEAAQRLVGNAPGEAAIEVVGLPFRFTLDAPRLVAATGRGVSLRARGTVGGWTAVFVRADEEVTLTGGELTRYAYLAVAGGLALDPVLGSRSSYLPAGIGPLPRPLAPGDALPLGPARRGASDAGRSVTPVGRERIAVMRGPHYGRFAAPETLVRSAYAVSERSDRMGVRLWGPPLRAEGEVLSVGVVAGAIQVPHGGEPIVLLADHQTTGGYPLIATVAWADLAAVAQAAPGETLSFYEVDRDQALSMARALRAWLGAIER